MDFTVVLAQVLAVVVIIVLLRPLEMENQNFKSRVPIALTKRR